MCYLLGSMTDVLKELVTSNPNMDLNDIIDTVHDESLIALRARLWFTGNIFFIYNSYICILLHNTYL
jgi:hypothetical protein